MNTKGKNYKIICHNCCKKGHTTNVCRSKNTNQNAKPKSMVHCHKCNKQAHQAHECRPTTMNTKIFGFIATTIRSMDIELLNVDPNPYGHQTNKQR